MTQISRKVVQYVGIQTIGRMSAHSGGQKRTNLVETGVGVEQVNLEVVEVVMEKGRVDYKQMELLIVTS